MRTGWKKKKLAARLLAGVMAFIMILQSVPEYTMIALAEGGGEEPAYDLKINGQSAAAANHLEIPYGQEIALTLDGMVEGESVSFFYATDEMMDAGLSEALNNGRCMLKPGEYHLIYELVKGPDTTLYPEDGEFVLNVKKAKLAPPSDLTWTGSVMSWTTPDTTVDGLTGAGTDVAGYELTVYKNGTEDKFHHSIDSKDTTVYNNIENNILGESDWGKGSYTFSVKAKADSDSVYFESSDESAQSGALVVPEITLEAGDNGIRNVSAGGSTSFLLIPGNMEKNFTEIVYEIRDHYSFAGWEGSEDVFDFTAKEGSSWTIRMKGMPESDSLTVSARSRDAGQPGLGTLEAGSTPGTIQISAVDNEKGIKYYAFSEQNLAANVENWEEVAEPKPVSDIYVLNLSKGGDYYFHAKDEDGNVTTTGSALQVTRVDLVNYCESNILKDVAQYKIGSDSYALPVPERDSWNFCGWYADEAFTSPVTEVSHNTSEGYFLYAKWEKQDIQNSAMKFDGNGISEEKVTITYDGKNHNLTVSPTNTGTVSYQWYKKNGETYEEIPGAVSGTYVVKNVADSGEYRVKITLDHGDGSSTIKEEDVLLTINRKTLNIYTKTEPAAAEWGDQEDSAYVNGPEYSVSYEGFAEGEGTGNITVGTLTFEYTKGGTAHAGLYHVYIGEDFAADNYEIHRHEGYFQVRAKSESAEAEFEDPEITEPGKRYVYQTGKEYKPAVIVRDKISGNVLTEGTDYTVEYVDNDHAGIAKAEITMQKNYDGLIELPFTIEKAPLTVSEIQVESWKYDGAFSGNLKIQGLPVDGVGKITWYFAEKDEEGNYGEFTKVIPKDVGTYEVKAEIAEGDNYFGTTIDTPVEFTVSPRYITVTANSRTFPYDGSAHSDHGYVVTGEGFAPKEGFAAVWTEGEVQNVAEGDVENVLMYRLSSVTKKKNYVITPVNGVINVGYMKLTIPSGLGWSTIHPGRASWVAVAKDDLQVKYQLWLYSFDGTHYEQIGDMVETADAYTDAFKSQIESHAKAAAEQGKAYTYFFRIQSWPAGGAAAGNYNPSSISAYRGPLCTAEVTLKMDHDDRGSVTFDNGETTLFMIQGDTAKIVSTLEAGYNFTKPTWYELSSGASVSLGTPTYTVSGGQNKLTVSLALSSAVKNSILGQVVTVQTYDEDPWVESYNATNAADLNQVTLSFVVKDGKALDSWMIKKNDSTMPSKDDAGWVAIEGNPTVFSHDFITSSEGEYYLFVKDTFGNVVSVKDNDPIAVYKITMKPGEGAEGADKVLFRAQNTTIVLPVNTYTKGDLAFQNWYGSTGIYPDQGSYGANSSDVLEAHWTDEYLDYTVQYYYMEADGTYPDTFASEETFATVKGATVTSALEKIQKTKTGYVLDTSEERSTSVTIRETGKIIPVYYKRSTYQVIYKYTLPDAEDETVNTVDYTYGADLTNAFILSTKPSVTGYKFVGWNFGETGSQPATMPAADVIATGTFIPSDAVYHIRYYVQDLGDGLANSVKNTYTLLPELNQDINAIQGETVKLTQTDLTKVDGFKFKGIYGAYGAAAGDVTKAASEVEKTVKADESNQLTFHVYLDREKYDITLNVWQGNVGEGTTKYTKTWPYYYGAAVDAAALADFNKASWPHDNEYELAEYVDYSTGSAPATMPNGDVTITRQFILKVVGEYKVEVWMESEKDGVYTKHEYGYFDNVGATVTVGPDESGATVEFSRFGKNIDYFEYYDYRVVTDAEVGNAVKGTGLTGGTVTTGEVTHTNNGETELVLRVFFERKEISTTIYYHYIADNSDTTVATAVKSQKWGKDHLYNCEPLALFRDTSGGDWVDNDVVWTKKAQTAGLDADAYNFWENCIVSYVGRYNWGKDTHWVTKNFDKVNDLDAENRSKYTCTMGYSGNQVDVYYTKVVPKLNYYLDVVYAPSTLSHYKKTEPDVPVTYTIGDRTYKLRYQNEGYFYTNVSYKPDDVLYAQYPGLALYNLKETDGKGRYIYSENPALSNNGIREGYEPVDIGGVRYFLQNEGEKGGYIYFPIKDNRLFYGNFTSANYNESKISLDAVTDFLSEYKGNYPDDPYAQGAHVYNSTWGTGVLQGNSTLRVSFRNGDILNLYFVLGHSVCSQHEYAKGATIYKSNVVCPDAHHTFEKRNGYDIIWYMDSECKTPVPDSFVLNTDTPVYGNYEKSNINCNEYAYYELANPVTRGGVTYSYITEKDLEAFDGDEKLASTTVGDLTTWTYDGDVVMVRKIHASKSFANVEMDATQYNRAGYKYDDANKNNSLKGYCQYTPISLRAYFVCLEYSLTINSSIPNDNPIIRKYKYGENVVLEKLALREGYTFNGWSYKKAGAAWTVEAPENGKSGAQGKDVTFRMPNGDVVATADWAAADYSQTVIYYFQKNDNGVLSYVEDAPYKKVKSPSLRQESKFNVWDYRWQDALEDYYVLSSVIRRLDSDINQYNPSEGELEADRWAGEDYKFTAEHGMVLEYYYALKEFPITLQAFEQESGESFPLTMLGGGDHFYGQKVKLSTSVPAGYDFIGWYKKADVLEGGSLKSDLSGITKECGTAEFNVTVKEAADYVAVIKVQPIEVKEHKLHVETSTIDNLIYGYKDSVKNTITAKVTFEDNASPANYVKSYQWYKDGVKVEGATGATFQIPQGWEVGTYKMTCEIVVARSDNKLEEKFLTDPTDVVVKVSDLNVSVTGFNNYYDGTNHSISVNVAALQDGKTATVYYSTSPLNSENYTSGSLTNPAYSDVYVDEMGNRGSRTIYYYVHTDSKNYRDKSGSAVINIRPVQLTMESGTSFYSKTYDGTSVVQGKIDEPGTDKYRLAHGTSIYKINGLISEDEKKGYIISCDAEFNSRHVSTANAVKLSHIKLADDKNKINYNYIFADEYEIILTGYITRRWLNLEWSDLSLPYNGDVQCAAAQFRPGDIMESDLKDIGLLVEGGQTTKGQYTATASVFLKEPETVPEGSTPGEGAEIPPASEPDPEKLTEIGDYAIFNARQPYEITGRSITIKPYPKTYEYDGEEHTLETARISAGSVVTGQTWTFVFGEYYTDANTYDITLSNGHVYDGTGFDVTDNYTISYDSSKMTIDKRRVWITGIEAVDKYYDGNTAAGLDFSKAELVNVLDTEDISFDNSTVYGIFEDKEIGKDKTVSVVYDTDNTLTASAVPGHETDIRNYRLYTENCTNNLQADISPIPVKVIVEDQEIVYGNTPAFTVKYEGLLDGETASDITIDPEHPITFTIGEVDGKEKDAVSYTSTTGVGEYKVYADISGLSGNYTFEMVPGKLTVNSRKVAVTGKTAVEKTYDGTDSATVTEGNYQFVVLTGEEGTTGPANGEKLKLKEGYTAVYNSKDVNSANKVTVTGLVLEDSNYQLVTTSFNIDGSIKQKDLTITAGSPSITYGATEKPEYTADYEGFVDGEDETAGSDLTGSLVLACDYDPAVAENRNVREEGYAITASSLPTSGNYNIIFTPGKLTVEKAVITFVAMAKKTANDAGDPVLTTDKSGDDPAVSRIYGTDPLPELSYWYDSADLKYTDSFDAAVTHRDASDVELMKYSLGTSGKPLEETLVEGSKVISSVPGNYAVKPDPSDLVSENYRFATETGSIKVNKYKLTIDNIIVSPKIYDGTKTVYQEQYNYDAEESSKEIHFDGLLTIDKNYFANHPEEKMIKINGSYVSKDVENNILVNISIEALDYLKARCYVVEESQTEAYADIQKRPLSITADNYEVFYGASVPAYTVTYGKVDGQEKSGLVTGETADASSVTITCGYQTSPSYSEVGDYPIEPSAWAGSASALVGNYDPVGHYANGNLKVKQTKFPSPVPVWGTEGNVSWDAVASIGDVSVAEYVVELYREGSLVEGSRQVITAGSPRQYNYTDLMRSLTDDSREGVYTVKVTAVAGTTNNEGKKNVLDSDPGESASRKAVTVKFVYEKRAEKQAGVNSAADLKVNNAAAYVMFEGEQDIPITAVLKNATGYTVDSVVTSNDLLKVKTSADGADSFRSGANYENKISLESGLADGKPLTVTLRLKARPATLTGELTPRPGEDQASATYGYSEEDRPELTMTVDVASGDTITKADYDYTYVWQGRRGQVGSDYFPLSPESVNKDNHTANNHISTWKFPLGQNANTNTSYYFVRCIVTAVRSDNGESISWKNTWNNADKAVTNVTIKRAPFSADPMVDDWTYGETRKAPRLENISAGVTTANHPTLSTPKYEYIEKSVYDADPSATGWTTTIPKNAGSYYVRATVEESLNYDKLTTVPKPTAAFKILPNKLATPTTLAMGMSGTASYGKISWDAVTGPKENAGAAGDSDSSITVTYKVVIYRKEGGSWTVVNTYENLSDVTKDVLTDVQSAGTYKFTVQAMSSNTTNCADSDIAESGEIEVGALISASENSDGTLDGNLNASTMVYSKMYNGKEVYIEAKYEGAHDVIHYVWYKGTEKIKEGDVTDSSKKFDREVLHVDDNAKYTCVMTLDNGTILYTPVLDMQIGKRKVTFTSATDSKVYDGTALTNGTVSVTEDGFVSGEGVTFNVTGTQTAAGSSKNTFSYTWNTGTKASDYTVTKTEGTLTVNKLEIIVAVTGDTKSGVYDGTEKTVSGYTYTVKKKADGTDVTLYTTSDFNYSETYAAAVKKGTNVIAKADAESDYGKYMMGLAASQFSNNNANFTVTFNVTDGWLQITPITSLITVNITGMNATKTYNGSEQSVEDYTIAVTGDSGLYKKADISVVSGDVKVEGKDVKTTGDGKYMMELTKEQFQNTNVNFANVVFAIEADGWLKITPKAVTIKVDNKSKVFGTSDPTLTGTVTGLVPGESLADFAYVRENASVNVVGEYKDVLTAAFTENKNYAVSITRGKFTITKADTLKVEGTDYDKPYDGGTHGEAAVASVTGLEGAPAGVEIYYSTNNGASWSTTVPTIKNVGTLNVKVKAEHHDYKTATAEYTLKVTQKAVTIKVADSSKVFGEDDPAFEGVVTGLVDGESLANLKYVRSNSEENNAGVYPDKLTAEFTADANYAVSITKGKFEIKQAENLMSVAGTSYNKPYDGETHGAAAVVSVSGMAGVPAGVTVTYSTNGGSTWSSTVPTIKNVGTVNVTVKAEHRNYKTVTAVYTLKVTQKAVTIKVADSSKVFGNPDPAFTGTVTGLVSGESLAALHYSRTNADVNTVGEYGNVLTATYTENSNYAVSVTTGKFTITPANTLKVEGTSYNQPYDGGTHGEAAVASVTGMEGAVDGVTIYYSTNSGDSWSSWSTTVPTIKDAKTINVKVKAVHHDYVTAENTYVLKVTPKAVTIKVTDSSKVFGEADPEFVGNVEGLVTGESLANLQYFRTNTDVEAAGTYSEVLDASYDNNDNYSVSVTKGKFSINKAGSMVVTGTGYDESYDGQSHGAAATVGVQTAEGIVNLTGATINYSTDGGSTWSSTVPTIKNVGTVNVKVKAEHNDYETVYDTYTLNVTPKDVTIKVTDSSKVFGEDDPAFEGEVEGLVNGESLANLHYVRTNADENHAGVYTEVLNAVFTADTNYSVSITKGKFTIEQASSMTVTADSYDEDYDGQSHGEAAVSNVAGAVISYSTDGGNTWSGEVPTVKKYGSVAVKVKAEHADYKTVTSDYTLTVNKKAVTVKVSDSSKVFGQSDPVFGGVVTGLVSGESLANLHYVRDNADVNSAGVYSGVLNAEFSADENYAVSVEKGKFTISQAEGMSVTGTGYDEIYDGQSHGVAAAASVAGLNEELTGVIISYSTDNGATWSTTVPTIQNAGSVNVKVKAEHNDYVTAYDTYELKVSQKAVTIDVHNAHKVFGKADPVFEGEVSGLVSGESLADLHYVRTNADVNVVGVYEGVLTAEFTADNNYAVSITEGDFEIVKATTLKVTGSSYEEPYDGQTHGAAAAYGVQGENGLENVDGVTVFYSTNGGNSWSTEVPTIKNVGTLNVMVKAEHHDYVTATTEYILKVNPKAVTITVDDQEKVYGVSDPAFTGVVDGLVDENDLGVIVYYRTGSDSHVGVYEDALDVSYTENSNYDVTVVKGKFTICKASELSVTATGYEDYYDGASHAVAAVVNITDGTVISYSVNGGADWSTEVPAITDSGSISVLVKAENPDYVTATDTCALVVLPRPVSITVSDSSKVFGAQDPVFTGNVSGLVQEDDLGQITYSRSGNDEDAGVYENVLYAAYTANSNYDVTVHTGKFTITRSGVLTVAGTGYDDIYDGQPHGVAAVVNVTESTTISYSVDGGETWSTEVPTITDAGVVNVLVKAENPNYVTATDTCILKADRKAVTITVLDAFKVYADADPVFEGIVSGLVKPGDLGNIVYSRSGNAENAGVYTDVLQAAYDENANYNVTVVKGSFTITPVTEEVTVTITGKTGEAVYDGTEHTVTGYEVTDISNALYREADFDFNGNAVAKRTGAGSTSMGLAAEQFVNLSSNFSNVRFIVTDGFQKITPRAVTIMVDDSEKVYGQADPVFTGKVQGLIKDSDLGQILYLRTTAAESAGVYSQVLDADFTENADYHVSVQKGSFVIRRSGALQVKGMGYSGIYDGAPHGDAALVNVTEGTVIRYSTDGGKTFGENVPFLTGTGTMHVIVKAENPDYETVTDEYELKITSRAVTLTVDDSSKIFGTPDPVFTGTVDGLVNASDLGSIVWYRTGSDEVTGVYADVLDAAYTANSNYSVTVNRGTFQITKAGSLTISGHGYSDVYDGKSHSVTAIASVTEGTTIRYSVDGGLTWSSDVPAIRDAGTITVKVRAEHHDYVTAEKDFILEVLPKEVTVTALSAEKIYGDEDPELTAKVEGLLNTDTIQYKLQRTQGENAGSYEIIPVGESLQGNYQIVFQGAEMKVLPRKLTYDVSRLIADKLVDGNNSARPYGKLGLTGMIGDEDPGFGYAALSGVYADSAVGEHLVTITVQEPVLTNPNYQLPDTCEMTGQIFAGINNVPSQNYLPEGEGSIKYRLVVSPDISIISSAFMEIEHLDTPEKVQKIMAEKVRMHGYSEEMSEFHEVEIQLSTNHGQSWSRAEGVEIASQLMILLPYPEGTNSADYDFFVMHMFAENSNGHRAGEIEYPAVEEVPEGLRVALGGLSPISISWLKTSGDPAPEAPGPEKPGSGKPNPGQGPSVSPKTEENLMNDWMLFMASAFCFGLAGMQVAGRKKRSKKN